MELINEVQDNGAVESIKHMIGVTEVAINIVNCRYHDRNGA
jgi:hypothetical protein